MYSSQSSLPSELYYFGKGDCRYFIHSEAGIFNTQNSLRHKLIFIHRIPRLPALIRPFQQQPLLRGFVGNVKFNVAG